MKSLNYLTIKRYFFPLPFIKMKPLEIVIFVVIIVIVVLLFFRYNKMEGTVNDLPCTCNFIYGPINCPSSGVCPGSSKIRCNPNC